LKISKYKSLKELEDDADYIKQFGDIPSVRRACKLLNKDPKFKNTTFNPRITPQTQKKLEERMELKQNVCQSLQREQGEICVTFD
jgi:predicted phosphoadenosine phosphosulfate sulfurtransferase